MKKSIIFLLAIAFVLGSCQKEEKNPEDNMPADVAARLDGTYASTSPFYATVDSSGTIVTKSDPSGYMIVNSVDGFKANITIVTSFDFPEKEYDVSFYNSGDFNNSSNGTPGFKYEYSSIEGDRSVNATFGVYDTDSTHLSVTYTQNEISFVKTCWKY